MPTTTTTTRTKTGVRLSADERREQVLDAAVEEFGERGYHGASTANIAKRAGISQPYIYALFSDKRELFLAVHHRVIVRDPVRLHRGRGRGLDPGGEARGHGARPTTR